MPASAPLTYTVNPSLATTATCCHAPAAGGLPAVAETPPDCATSLPPCSAILSPAGPCCANSVASPRSLAFIQNDTVVPPAPVFSDGEPAIWICVPPSKTASAPISPAAPDFAVASVALLPFAVASCGTGCASPKW